MIYTMKYDNAKTTFANINLERVGLSLVSFTIQTILFIEVCILLSLLERD